MVSLMIAKSHAASFGFCDVTERTEENEREFPRIYRRISFAFLLDWPVLVYVHFDDGYGLFEEVIST